MTDIKRRTELHIVHQLKLAIPDHNFVPFTGGDENTDATEIEPPFTVVSVSDASKVMATESTWICTGVVQVITNHVETKSGEQSDLARRIYKALDNIPSYSDPEFSLHGIDIQDMTAADDKDAQAHADVISFAAGVGG